MPGQAAGSNPGFIAPMLATAAVGLPDRAGIWTGTLNHR
jgi:hypothetical protein